MYIHSIFVPILLYPYALPIYPLSTISPILCTFLKQHTQYILYIIYPICIYINIIKCIQQQSKTKMSRNLVLDETKRPYLLIQNYHPWQTQAQTQNRRHQEQQKSRTIFIITTIDRWVFVVSVSQTNDSIMHKFRVQNSVNSVCLDYSRHMILLGCIDGNILKYSIKQHRIAKQQYIQHNRHRPQLLCLYSRPQYIYAWNLNSELVIVNYHRMELVNRLAFGVDITACIYINYSQLDQMSPCIAFQNNMPPFIFDHTHPSQIVDTYQLISQNYSTNQDLIDQQIIIIAYQKDKPHSDFIICATMQHSISPNYYICKYNIVKQNKYYLSVLNLRIQLDNAPIFISIYQENVFVCLWKEVLLVDLNKRKIRCRVTNQSFSWAFVIDIKVQNHQRVYLVLLSKGFNFWLSTQSRKNKASLHIIKKIQQRSLFLQYIQD